MALSLFRFYGVTRLFIHILFKSIIYKQTSVHVLCAAQKDVILIKYVTSGSDIFTKSVNF